jgi:hypothetical protein
VPEHDYAKQRNHPPAELNELTKIYNAAMSGSVSAPALDAAWRHLAERLKPLAAAAAAAGQDSSSSLSRAQCTDLARVADDIEQFVNWRLQVPGCAFTHAVPDMLLESGECSTASSTCGTSNACA